MKPQFPKHLTIILKEMCRRVGADFDKLNFKRRVGRKEWFMRYKWTEKEELDFKKWFVNYLYKNREARKELLEFPSIYQSKRELEKVASWFLLDYGWRCDYEI